MSLFKTATIACPACGSTLDFETVHSVNADRRPDLRAAILAGEFQRMTCPVCTARFRLDPDFNYLDVGRRQWIVAAPVAAVAEWPTREAAARQLFARAYGTDAPELARDIGLALRPRLTFGWPALREKLLAAEHGIDDIALEACKAIVMRAAGSVPLAADTDLRLVDVDRDVDGTGGKLVMAWLRSFDGREGDAFSVPRSECSAVAADASGTWSAFRRGFDAALFVDLNRTLLPAP